MAEYQYGSIKVYPNYNEQDYMYYGDGDISVKYCQIDNTITVSVQNLEEKNYVSIHLTRKEFIEIFNKVIQQTFLSEGNHDE